MAILIAMLCACGAIPKFQTETEKQMMSKTAAKWVGRTVDELIVEHGEPINVDALDAGIRVFEYGNIETGQPKARKRTKRTYHAGREVTFSGAGQLVLGESTLPRTESSATIKTKSASQPCRILFTISASDIVEKWVVEGKEDCGS